MILRLRFVVIDNCSFVTPLDWVRILKISKEIFCYHKKKKERQKKNTKKDKNKRKHYFWLLATKIQVSRTHLANFFSLLN